MFLYNTVAAEGSFEETISRSRFIAQVKPILSYEEGQTFVASIRAAYKDATHNVPAIVFGPKQELQWMSDDGEPQGTAGPPILKMIVDEELTNVAVVVTRYFGGIKLGTGGLVRAFQGIAKKAIESVGTVSAYDGIALTYDVDYAFLDRLHSLAAGGRFDLRDDAFAEKVTVTAVAASEDAGSVRALFNDVTSGKCVLKEEKMVVKFVDRP